MDENQFEQVKNIPEYELWMNTALQMDNLSVEDFKKFMEHAFVAVYEAPEKDPVEMLEQAVERMRPLWKAAGQMPFHGNWFHGMVPAIILKSLQNNGYEIEGWQIHEAFQRGLMIPAGGCGFCGVCGAGSGLGIALSLLQKSNPFFDKERSISMQMSAKAIDKIAKFGGIRCCRLSSYTALGTAVTELEKMDYSLPKSDLIGRCKVHEQNPSCHGMKCPYFPRK